MPIRPFDAGIRSSGIVSPTIRSASSAPRRNVSVARSTSTSASRIGLPASSAMSRPELLAAGLDPGADVPEDRAALVGRQRPGHLERRDGRLDRLLVLRLASRGTSRPAGWSGWAGLLTSSRSSDSTQRPARKIGWGFVPAVVVIGRLLGWSVMSSYPADGPTNPPPTCAPPSASVPARVSISRRSTRRRRTGTRRRSAAELAAGLERLTDLQDRLWAEGKHTVLVVLQGIDAAGKDGTVRHVMGAFNPQGCPVTSFKVPVRRGARPRLPLAHPPRGPGQGRDRHLQPLPLRGRARRPRPRPRPEGGLVASATTRSTSSSGLLAEEGTTIVKFFLYIDRDEQRERLQARSTTRQALEVPLGDLEERKRWDDYTARVRGHARRAARPTTAPWYVIPANRKWFRNLAVADDPGRHARRPEAALPEPAEDLKGVTVGVAAAPGRESRCGDVAPDEPRLEWRRGAGGERLDPLPR